MVSHVAMASHDAHAMAPAGATESVPMDACSQDDRCETECAAMAGCGIGLPWLVHAVEPVPLLTAVVVSRVADVLLDRATTTDSPPPRG